MAPLWHTFVEPGKTRALLYVVDASSPETVGIATIHLVEMLHAPGIEVKGTQSVQVWPERLFPGCVLICTLCMSGRRIQNLYPTWEKPYSPIL